MTRYGVSLGPAMLVTFALFWTMQSLVSVGFELIDGEPPFTINWVRLIQEKPPLVEPRKTPPRPKPVQAPTPPPIGHPLQERGLDDGALQLPLVEGREAAREGLEASGSDRGLVAMVRPEPDYPPAAERRGITGWAKVEFTVTSAGLVRDARIVASQPDGIFDASALRAIERWRYKPRVLGGRPVDTPGVMVLLEFRL